MSSQRFLLNQNSMASFEKSGKRQDSMESILQRTKEDGNDTQNSSLDVAAIKIVRKLQAQKQLQRVYEDHVEFDLTLKKNKQPVKPITFQLPGLSPT